MSGPRGNEARRRAIAVLVATTAVSSLTWSMSVTGSEGAPFPWVAGWLEVVISLAQVVAAVLVVRGADRLRTGALALLAVPFCGHASALPSHISFLLASPQWTTAWATATAVLALVAAVLVLTELASLRGTIAAEAPPRLLRAGTATGALLLALTSMFAWSVSPSTGPGRVAFVLGSAGLALMIASLLGAAVLVVTAAALVLSRSWPVTIGLLLGALVSRPLAPLVLVDPSWRASEMALAMGWWLALVGQLVLVTCLVAILWRRARAAPRGAASNPVGVG